eukprot:TRINITY_DN4882_c0_g1_i1.p1 TRINITY_DN4882_c0_g1~~TRINITY_DN4882_c0_g1_i1.p1  ORF type:complete len:220 (-),score=22.07 TRINITY_DN4882_c0_g1_i1:546-1205(-)
MEEWIFFTVGVNSSEPLLSTEVARIDTELVCLANAEPMREIFNWETGWTTGVTGAIHDHPDPQSQCLGDISSNTVNFEFELDPDFFQIPMDDSCSFRVWVVVDLFYTGITRPDGRQPAQPNLLLEQNDVLLAVSDTEQTALGDSRWVRLRTNIQFATELEPGRRERIEGDNLSGLSTKQPDPISDGSQNSQIGPEKASGFRCVPLYFTVVASLLFLILC